MTQELEATDEPELVAPDPTTDVTNWKPNPGPQELALMQPDDTFELLYGGARGGGKTDAGLVWIQEPHANPRYQGLVIRKNADDLSDWLRRAEFMYRNLGAEQVGKPAVIRFPSGAIIRTGHLKDDDAYTKYQGHEYQRILLEELTQIPTELRYMQLISSCRSTQPSLRPRVMATTNPGGVGHGWVKERFVDAGIPMKRFEDPTSNRLRMFVPAKIDDNPVLVDNDPDYVRYLDSLKDVDEELYKAWRLGSWDVFAGQYFKEFRYDEHVTPRFEWSLDVCTKIISFDWGYNDPGAAHWLALTPENQWGVRHVYVYRELHQSGKEPAEWAVQIRKFIDLEPVDYMVLPHDCFAHKESRTTIASTFRTILQIPIKRGHTLERGARLNRAAITHRFLSTAPDGRPYMQIHPSCLSLIKTLPTLIHSSTNVEDVDTTGDDHDYDSLSLGLTSLNYVPGESAILNGANLMQQIGPRAVTVDPMGNVPAPNFWQEFQRREKYPQSQDPEFM